MHGNFIFLADFDRNIKDSPMKEFYEMSNLSCLINKSQCFKNPTEPICSDTTNKLILIQRLSSAHKPFQINISDFHLLTLTELKMNFQKL